MQYVKEDLFDDLLVEDRLITQSMESIDRVLTESVIEEYENHYISEKTSETIIDKIKRFFAKLVANFKQFADDIKNRVTSMMRQREFKQKLHMNKEKLLQAKERGLASVDIVDYYACLDELKGINKGVWKFIKKFERNKYKKVSDVEDDIDTLHQYLNDCEAELEEVCHTKVSMKIDKAIELVDSQLNGVNDLYKEVNNELTQFEDLKNRARAFEVKYNIAGESIIEERKGIINAITGAFAKVLSWFKKQFLKVFTVTIFLFA